jgi:CxxC motif-containing protein (DUF1111 family)
MGGGGDVRHNVAAFEVHPVQGRPDVQGGVVHAFATASECREDPGGIHTLFPVVKGGLKVVGTCFSEVRDFDPVHFQSLNPTALFGAGWIDRISSKTILHQSRQRSWEVIARELRADWGAVPPGRPRILADGRVGKFGWKAQFATLQEFVAAACANELGLGNPILEQARPWGRATYPKVDPDLNGSQFRSLVAFVDTLPRPVEAASLDARERGQVDCGKALFGQIGCAICHTPDLGGISGIYSDFLLHQVTPAGGQGSGYTEIPNLPLPPDHPRPNEWKTPPLWGVADSAPYFHDGGSPTLEAAIRRHKSDAGSVTRAFEELPASDRAAIIAFLKSLRAPGEAESGHSRSRPFIAMAH